MDNEQYVNNKSSTNSINGRKILEELKKTKFDFNNNLKNENDNKKDNYFVSYNEIQYFEQNSIFKNNLTKNYCTNDNLNRQCLTLDKEINFDNKKGKKSIEEFYNQTNNLNNIKLLNTLSPTDINHILNISEKETIIDYVKKDMYHTYEELRKIINPYIMMISLHSSNNKNVYNKYNEIINILTNQEDTTNDILNFYDDYKSDNKSFLIRNSILNYFLSNININQEDKEILSKNINVKLNNINDNTLEIGNQSKSEILQNQSSSLLPNIKDTNQTYNNYLFFNLLNKIKKIKERLNYIENNLEGFSKTLYLSLKENIANIEDIINEKLILYLKNCFKEYLTIVVVNKNENQTNKKEYSKKISDLKSSSTTIKKLSNSSLISNIDKCEYNKESNIKEYSKLNNIDYRVQLDLSELRNIITGISFIKNNENYLIFLQKEYINFRKRNVGDAFKEKYTNISTIINDTELYNNYNNKARTDVCFNQLEESFSRISIALCLDLEFTFLKEVLLMYTLFYNEYNILINDDILNILELLNKTNLSSVKDFRYFLQDNISNYSNLKTSNLNTNINNLLNLPIDKDYKSSIEYKKCLIKEFMNYIDNEYQLLYKINYNSKNIENKFDFSKFLSALNTIFFYVSEWLYENLNKIIKGLTENNPYNFLSCLKMSTTFEILKFKLQSMFSCINIKKEEFSNLEIYNLLTLCHVKSERLLIKAQNELEKKLTKIKVNLLNYIIGDPREFETLLLSFYDIINLYKFVLTISNTLFKRKTNTKDDDSFVKLDYFKKILNSKPLSLVLNIFNNFNINDYLANKFIISDSKQVNSIKVFNFIDYCKELLDNNLKENLEANVYNDLFIDNNVKDIIIEIHNVMLENIQHFIFKNILIESNLEEKLTKVFSQDQAYIFMEEIVEHIKYNYLIFDYIDNDIVKQITKNKINDWILSTLVDMFKKQENCLYVITEEDIKDYLI